ncbi:glycosyltransferase [Candidatus Kaiserbacteria bacterium CG_4_9_14_0_2_um_filter_41_32]|uniref:Glycosyltransferase n=2 Tax=Patescibacteria group TaxID=1783273 RepID=A0A2M8FEB8_9BACT|nr:MAG: glycosyltransferase [Candidatus Roizmanbacteria bacterium CG11_big_fil_rev_8_21_14_0_20_36_8]PJC55987.1 MAG: glycosyltransferase [Candidatus Kaiserbacteria bacterium CG_4_9_14_0_2_um_filter_41_32]
MSKDEVKQNTKKRVLIVIGTLAIGGGAEKVAATIGSELTRRGHEVHLLTFYEAPQTYPFSGILASFHDQPKSRFHKALLIPAHVWKIYRYVKKHKIELTVSFLEEANFQLLVSKILFRWSLPVIASVRNNIEKREWLFKLATRLLYPFAKKVVSVTKAVEEILKTQFHLKNIVTIYNPLDIEMISEKAQIPLPTEYAPLFSSHPICISIGRLIHQKGQWHLIRAFVEVRQAHPQAKLVILGEGEYREKLEQLISDCGLSDSVFLIGKHENVYQFLAAADVFAFSSLWEGMPNTMLEALAVGLPIVSPDCISGPREIIAPGLSITNTIAFPHETDLGVLTVPLENDTIWFDSKTISLSVAEQQLAQEVIKLLHKPLTKNIKAVTAAKNTYSILKTVDAWEQLIIKER